MAHRAFLGVRRITAALLAAVLIAAAFVFVSDPPRAVAAPGDECPAVPIWVNTWSGSGGVLAQYSPTGTPLSSVPVTRAFGDIALSTDGTRLYGTSFDSALPWPELYRIDPSTGAIAETIVLDSGYVTTLTPSERMFNSLTAISENVVLTGGPSTTRVVAYDFSTDTTSLYATLPGGRVLAGDFSVLRDGDILVSSRNAAGTQYDLLRLHPDGTFTAVGLLPGAVFGMAQSGGKMYFASSTGELWSLPISSIPKSASTAELAVDVVAATGLPFYGATSVQDGSVCNALSLTKQPAPATVADVGDTVAYTFTITNVSDVTISSLTLSDVQQAPAGALASGPTCTVTTLAPQASTTCTASYVVTQTDLDHGSISDTAVAAGVTPTGQDVESNRASATVAVTAQPELTIVKAASPTTVTQPGTLVSYTFDVTNTGNQTVQDVAIDETAFSGSGSMSTPVCPVTFLQPGDAVQCTATYTVTQADIDDGGVQNTATATGTTLGGTPVTSAPAVATVTATQNPSLRLVKSATPSSAAEYTDQQDILYSFVVTNDGNVTIEDVHITEVAFDGANGPLVVTCPAGAASLAPGAQVVCTAPYQLNQIDIDRLSTTNTARAEGETPGGTPVASADSTVVLPGTNSPALTLDKEVAPTATKAGDVLAYTFTITNSGNVTLTDIDVEEVAFSGTGTPTVDCPSTGPLLPGQVVVCTASYTVTQDDVDAGSVTNTARATALDTIGGDVVSPDDSAAAPIEQTPALEILKTADAAAATGAGDVVQYSFRVTNTGNVTLTGVTVSENTFSGTGTPPVATCPVTTLAPGDVVTCTASYTLTQTDVDTGVVANSALATGTPPAGAPVDSTPSEAIATIDAEASLSLRKTASWDRDATPGDLVVYTFEVTNTGDLTLTDVTVDETAFTGIGTLSDLTCEISNVSLAPGATTTCYATYPLTQGDIDTGQVDNTAVATGHPLRGPDPTSDPSSAVVVIDRTAGIAVVKSASLAGGSAFTAGSTVEYSFRVTNTGNVTLTDIVVAEEEFTGTGTLSAVVCPSGPLGAGQQITCTATYVLTSADADAGSLRNRAAAEGTDPGGDSTRSDPSTALLTASGGGSSTGGLPQTGGGGVSPLVPVLALAAVLAGLWLLSRRRTARD